MLRLILLILLVISVVCQAYARPIVSVTGEKTFEVCIVDAARSDALVALFAATHGRCTMESPHTITGYIDKLQLADVSFDRALTAMLGKDYSYEWKSTSAGMIYRIKNPDIPVAYIPPPSAPVQEKKTEPEFTLIYVTIDTSHLPVRVYNDNPARETAGRSRSTSTTTRSISTQVQSNGDTKIVGNPISYYEGAKIEASDGTYLGCISTDTSNNDSVTNKIGKYGVPLGTNCIWNKYGKYGNAIWGHSDAAPPKIYLQGVFVSYLTADPTYKPRLDPNMFKVWTDDLYKK